MKKNFFFKISLTIKMSTYFGDTSTPFRTSYVQSDALGQPTSCYATLAGYNSRVAGTINGPTAVSARRSQKFQAVPVWGSMGYEALTHGENFRCGGYFTIEGAYPDYSSKCGKMMRRACAGVINQRR